MKDLIQDEKIMCASFGPINQVHKTTKVPKPKPNKIFEYFTSVAIKFALELFFKHHHHHLVKQCDLFTGKSGQSVFSRNLHYSVRDFTFWHRKLQGIFYRVA